MRKFIAFLSIIGVLLLVCVPASKATAAEVATKPHTKTYKWTVKKKLNCGSKSSRTTHVAQVSFQRQVTVSAEKTEWVVETDEGVRMIKTSTFVDPGSAYSALFNQGEEPAFQLLSVSMALTWYGGKAPKKEPLSNLCGVLV